MKFYRICGDEYPLTVNIPDIDAPVRRIFPLERFLSLLRGSEMALVKPELWDDPREDPAALCQLDGWMFQRNLQQQLVDFLSPVWAQSWSLNPGSDALLRAYSKVEIDGSERRNKYPQLEGVAVTTTIRKLADLTAKWYRDGTDYHFVLGGVVYCDDDQISQHMADLCNDERYGIDYLQTVEGRSESLLWKREYFSHEQEVRLMAIRRGIERSVNDTGVILMPIDVNEIADSISFDPRLVEFERMEREELVRQAGYQGRVDVDRSYQQMLQLIRMRKDWRN